MSENFAAIVLKDEGMIIKLRKHFLSLRSEGGGRTGGGVD